MALSTYYRLNFVILYDYGLIVFLKIKHREIITAYGNYSLQHTITEKQL